MFQKVIIGPELSSISSPPIMWIFSNAPKASLSPLNMYTDNFPGLFE